MKNIVQSATALFAGLWLLSACAGRISTGTGSSGVEAGLGGTSAGASGGTGGSAVDGSGGSGANGSGGSGASSSGGSGASGSGGGGSGGSGANGSGGSGGVIVENGGADGGGAKQNGNDGGAAVCGNGIVERGETCDDGGTNGCGPCNATCTGPGSGSTCGDGVVCADTEKCDDGFQTACGACNADCSGPGSGSACGDGVACADTEQCDDGYLDACGPCGPDCKTANATNQAHAVCYPGCADGTPEQGFSNGAVGCAGSVTYANRNTLCAPTYTACSAVQWSQTFAAIPPKHDYWTDDVLKFTGSSGNCSVSTTTGATCNAGQPMRICVDAVVADPETNTCNWSGCGLNATSPNDHFGGCDGDTTAGTLCCPHGCADGTVEQTFSNGMVGCAGKAPFAERASLCAPGCSACTAQQWVDNAGGTAPSHDYWTNDLLHYTGNNHACAVGTTGTDCGASTPMRVCVDSVTAVSTDPEGNACNWSECGLNTNTNQHFGGCGNNTSAGTLCCCQ